MSNIVKIFLAILLIICLAKMPYGYYQLVRFSALIGFGLLAYIANGENKKKEVVVYIILAILFQPLIKIPLGREIWNIVDVIVAIGLLLSLFAKEKRTK